MTLQAESLTALLPSYNAGGGGGRSALAGARDVAFEVETTRRVAFDMTLSRRETGSLKRRRNAAYSGWSVHHQL